MAGLVRAGLLVRTSEVGGADVSAGETGDRSRPTRACRDMRLLVRELGVSLGGRIDYETVTELFFFNDKCKDEFFYFLSIYALYLPYYSHELTEHTVVKAKLSKIEAFNWLISAMRKIRGASD